MWCDGCDVTDVTTCGESALSGHQVLLVAGLVAEVGRVGWLFGGIGWLDGRVGSPNDVPFEIGFACDAAVMVSAHVQRWREVEQR